jgi:porin-like protein
MRASIMTCAFAAVLMSAVLMTARLGSAQTVKVDFYGTLLPALEYVGTSGATDAGTASNANQVAAYSGRNEPYRFRMTAGTSNIGFNGSVGVVPDWLTLVWQIESGAQVDGEAVANTIASRNSRVGVSGAWGTLFFGVWDTPYKWATLPIVNPIPAGYVADYNTIMNTPGFGVGALNTGLGRVNTSSDAAFYRRESDSVQYWSPNLWGFSARVAYVIDEGRTSATDTTAAIEPQIFSGSLSYDHGALKLRYAAELHKDYFGLAFLGGTPGATPSNSSSLDYGQTAAAAYTFEYSDFSTRLVGIFDYLFYSTDDTVVGGVDEYQRPAAYALIDQGIFDHHVWLAYGKAWAGSCSLVGDEDCSTGDLGAQFFSLGYVYHVTDRIDAFAFYYRLVNERSASYTPFPPAPPVPAAGADVQSVGLGILYRFNVSLVDTTPPP